MSVLPNERDSPPAVWQGCTALLAPVCVNVRVHVRACMRMHACVARPDEVVGAIPRWWAIALPTWPHSHLRVCVHVLRCLPMRTDVDQRPRVYGHPAIHASRWARVACKYEQDGEACVCLVLQGQCPLGVLAGDHASAHRNDDTPSCARGRCIVWSRERATLHGRIERAARSRCVPDILLAVGHVGRLLLPVDAIHQTTQQPVCCRPILSNAT